MDIIPGVRLHPGVKVVAKNDAKDIRDMVIKPPKALNKQNSIFKRVNLTAHNQDRLRSIPRPSGILYTVPQARIRENKLKVFTFASNNLNKQVHVPFTGSPILERRFIITY